MKTKIISTLGPATKTSNIIRSLKKQGVNLVRINTAHGNFEQYEEFIKHAKKNYLPIILDLKGPDLRVKLDKPLIVKKKEQVKFYRNKTPCFKYDIINNLKTKDSVFFDNGLIKSKVKEKTKDYIILEFYEDATILENKGVNIPNKKLKVPNLSKKDLESIKFGNKHEVEFFALSFVRNKEDIKRLRKKTDALIISKIENKEGVKNIDEIIKESDAVMIARGDLAVEVGKENVPFIQKEIISKCNKAGNPCIVATQMLESMTTEREPTRAEVSDVANAALDGTDAVMLSGETAIGKHPVLTVKEMRQILKETEKHVKSKNYEEKNDSEQLISAAAKLIEKTKITKAICLTKSGYTATMLSRHKINKEIIAITRTNKTKAYLELSRGVKPTILNKTQTQNTTKTLIELKKQRIINTKDKIIILRNKKQTKSKITNSLEIYNIKEI